MTNETQENETLPEQEESAQAKEDPSSFEESFTTAPSGYSEEYAKRFAELPQNWRCYLHNREAEINKGFQELKDRAGTLKEFEESYQRRAEKLKSYGINSQEEWVKALVKVDELLSDKPKDAIDLLSSVYGAKPATTGTIKVPQDEKMSVLAALNDHMVRANVDNFILETDGKGALKHPHFKEVIPEMCLLLSNGMSKDIEDAYDKALWLNNSTRNSLLAKHSQASLELQSKDAEKSKRASFAPKGKAEPEEKPLTLREEIEKQFAAFGLLDDED